MVSEQIVIRDITQSDFDDWARLWRAYLAFYETDIPSNVYETTFHRLLSNDPHEFNGRIAVTPEGNAVGLVHFLFHRHGWKIENVCYLQDLFADPEYRGRGVGRALIEEVYRSADAEGASSVYWLTQDFNHTARNLYDRVAQLTPFIKYQRG